MFSGTTIDRSGRDRTLIRRLAERLWLFGVLVRVVAVCALLLGPWTNHPDELAGWDVERFQAIAERAVPGWSEFPIEYPPGSVVVFDAVSGSTVVETSRAIVVLAALAELSTVLLLWRQVGERSAKAYLVLGLPLVPMGFVRLDLLVVTLAITAAVLLAGQQAAESTVTGNVSGSRQSRAVSTVVFSILIAAGAMVKIWPMLVVAGALAIRRLSAAATAVAVTGLAGVVWLIAVGDGLTPVDQVLSLRGATGWHVESLPGALAALVGSQDARLELNAFRIGTLKDGIVDLGRAGALLMIAALIVTGLRASNRTSSPAAGDRYLMAPIERLAVVVLGSVAALIVTAPLLSPQFLLWLIPWGALLVTDEVPLNTERRQLLAVLGLVVTLTGGTLVLFGPPNLAGTVPAALLTIRNLGLLLIPVLCLRALHRGGSAGHRS